MGVEVVMDAMVGDTMQVGEQGARTKTEAMGERVFIYSPYSCLLYTSDAADE